MDELSHMSNSPPLNNTYLFSFILTRSLKNKNQRFLTAEPGLELPGVVSLVTGLIVPDELREEERLSSDTLQTYKSIIFSHFTKQMSTYRYRNCCFQYYSHISTKTNRTYNEINSPAHILIFKCIWMWSGNVPRRFWCGTILWIGPNCWGENHFPLFTIRCSCALNNKE